MFLPHTESVPTEELQSLQGNKCVIKDQTREKLTRYKTIVSPWFLVHFFTSMCLGAGVLFAGCFTRCQKGFGDGEPSKHAYESVHLTSLYINKEGSRWFTKHHHAARASRHCVPEQNSKKKKKEDNFRNVWRAKREGCEREGGLTSQKGF